MYTQSREVATVRAESTDFGLDASGTCCMLTHTWTPNAEDFKNRTPTCQSEKSLTCFALLSHCHVDVGQPDVSGLVLDEHQADEGENQADRTRG